MTTEEKANQIANKFITKSIFDMDDNELAQQRSDAKKHAITCVDFIIEALEVTTGHLDLKKRDLQELDMDFDFWDKVKTKIVEL